jgi:hypothetical protein
MVECSHERKDGKRHTLPLLDATILVVVIVLSVGGKGGTQRTELNRALGLRRILATVLKFLRARLWMLYVSARGRGARCTSVQSGGSSVAVADDDANL